MGLNAMAIENPLLLIGADFKFFYSLKLIFERIFYYLLTKHFETKEKTTFSPVRIARAPILCFCYCFLYADVSMGARQEVKVFYYRTLPLSLVGVL